MKQITGIIFVIRLFCFGTVAYFYFNPLVILLSLVASVILLLIEAYVVYRRRQKKEHINLLFLMISLLFTIHIGGYLFMAYEVISLDSRNWNIIVAGGLLVLSLLGKWYGGKYKKM